MALLGLFYLYNVYAGCQCSDCAIAKHDYLKYTLMDLGNYSGLVLEFHQAVVKSPFII